VLPREGSVGLTKFVEHMRQECRRDADTGVGDLQFRVPAARGDVDGEHAGQGIRS
jgi:hypothetical protein